MTYVENLIAKYRRFIGSRGWMLFSGSALLAVGAWIFIPSALHPYVRVSGDTLQFSVSCMPESVRVKLLTAETAISPGSISAVDERTGQVLKAAPVNVQASAGRYSAQYWLDTPPDIVSAVEATRDRVALQYVLSYPGAANIDLKEISFGQGDRASCVSTSLAGRTLFANISNHNKSLMHYRLLQEEIAGILYRCNSEVSNVILGLMLVALFWEFYLIGLAMLPRYLHSDAKLLRDLKRRRNSVPLQLGRQGLEAVARADFEDVNRRLVFAKTMGPALGFLLTVSSLSAALHPGGQDAQDTFHFVTAIEIAVVATFVGLALRITAQFAQWVYRDVAERQLVLLDRTRGKGGAR